jgi:streptogramin lyase
VETDFGADAAFADNPVLSGISITSDGSVYFTDFNNKVVINLPEAAQKAQEVSPDQFTQ